MRRKFWYGVFAVVLCACVAAAMGQTALPTSRADAAAATAERRVRVIDNDEEIGLSKPTAIVPEGAADATSAVCAKTSWTVISDAIDISDWDKDRICLEMWMHISDAAALNGAPYDINNMGIALVNDGNNWVNYRYLSWFPTSAEINTWTDGWNKISIHFAREAQQKPELQFAMDFSAVKLCVQAYMFDDLYLHDVFLTERAQTQLSVVTEKQPIVFDAKSLTINAKTLKLERGANFFLSSAVRPRSAAERVRVAYESSDETVATVDGTGKISAKTAGRCIVTARVPVTRGPDIVAKVTVTVVDELTVNTGNRIAIDAASADRRGSAGGDAEYDGVLWPGAAGVWRASPANNGSATVVANYAKHSAAGIGRVNLSAFTEKYTVLRFNLFIPDKSDLAVGNTSNSCAFGISDSLAYATWSVNHYLYDITQDFWNRLQTGWNAVSVKLTAMKAGGQLNKADAAFLFCQPPEAGRMLGFNGITVLETLQDEDIVVTPCGDFVATQSLTASETVRVSAGASAPLDVRVEPENATCREFLRYTSSDDTVARVDDNGNVRGVGVGNATITVSVIGSAHSVTAQVTVSAAEAARGLRLDTAKKKVSVGDRFTLGVSAEGSVNPEVVWQTDDPTVAVVDASGRVTVVGEGRTVIRAMSWDGAERAECALMTTGFLRARNGTITAAVLGGVGGLALIGGAVAVALLRRKKNTAATAGEEKQ